MNNDKRDLIVLVAELTLSMSVYAPLVLYYYRKFKHISNLMVIKKRYPKLTMLLCKGILFNLLITMPIQALSWSTVLMNNYKIFEIINRLSFILTPLTSIPITYILALKCWHMFYDLNWLMADRNSVWKYHMNPKLTQCDFWLRNKQTLGSISWNTKHILIPLWLLTSIISIILLQLYGMQFNTKTYYIAHVVTCFFFASPGFFIGILYFKMSKCNDNFFLKDEFAILSKIIEYGVFSYIGTVILATYEYFIGGLLNYFVNITVFFLLAMCSTWYIRAKIICNIKMFNYVIDNTNTNKRNNFHIDVGFLFGEFGTALVQTPTISTKMTQTPTVSTNTIDGIEIPTLKAISLHSESIRSSVVRNSRSGSNESTSTHISKNIKLYHLITSVETFEIFMGHLASEFSLELLLSMVTIIQWKRTFFNIYKDINNGNEIPTNQCHHGCPLNNEIPIADMILKYFWNKNEKSYKKFKSNEELIIAAKKSA
eukprot:157029_1